MSDLPERIIRLDDGEVFILIENDVYIMERNYEDMRRGFYTYEYTYERLMEDPRSKGKFKVADGTEDLKAMKQAWLDSFEKYDGHGDEDDE